MTTVMEFMECENNRNRKNRRLVAMETSLSPIAVTSKDHPMHQDDRQSLIIRLCHVNNGFANVIMYVIKGVDDVIMCDLTRHRTCDKDQQSQR